MTEGAPILYFAPQTCARVTLTALEEIGRPFETRLIAFLAGEHRKPEFLAINPSGKVPALQTDAGVIVQNGAILSFLAEVHPEAGLLPRRRDAAGRAAVLAELFRCSSDLHPLVTRFVLPQMMSAEETAAPQIRVRAKEGLEFQLAPLDARLERQDWCLEEGWSIIDAYLAWIWFRITGAGFDGAAFPAIAGHYERASARPSAKAALEHEAKAEQELERRGLLFRPPPVGKH
jgi:glutathione S-transferase